MTDYDILPATISHDILTNLLRDKLNFNGVVITDASHMVGFTGVKNVVNYYQWRLMLVVICYYFIMIMKRILNT